VANLNKVLLMGNLTRDPEVRYTPSGSAVCEFGLAINRRYTTRDNEQREETCFVDVAMWGRRGQVISEYFRKGSPIFIEGRLHYRQWEDQNGRRQSKLSVVADNFEFLGGGRGGSGRGAEGAPSRERAPRGGAPRDDEPRGPVGPMEPTEEHDVTDDDIPF
jgi:single-strand DNA-binding protein